MEKAEIIKDITFVNTQEFRREALFFEKNGYYCSAPRGTPDYKVYWDEQLRRRKQGYTVGGITITGDHYHYLNFSQIRLTSDPNERGKTKQKVRKRTTFPHFWDGDYHYFHAKNKAEILGKHLIVGKARRKGYSFKNGAIVANAYDTEPGIVTVIAASDKKYLYPKGTMSMASDNLEFLNQHTAWRKRRLINKIDHKMSGYTQLVSGIPEEKGYKSHIIAVTCGDNPDAIRGKDGVLILMEEAGKFPGLKDTFISTQPTVEDGVYTTGLIIIFGTGGGDESNWADFEEMFYDPDTFNLLAFENVWDEDSSGTSCGFFVPDYMNKPGFMDKEGNSLKSEAISFEEQKRKNIRKANDPKVIDSYTMERPFNPMEAFCRSSDNIFPTYELNIWLNQVEREKIHINFPTFGRLYRSDKGVEFRLDAKARPVYDYPIKKGEDNSGCIVQYYPPYRLPNGQVPPYMHIICLDPYAHDSSTGDSVGAAYVIRRINNLSSPNDIIVASYVGRPKRQDDFNFNVFMLAEYYNAQIGFENDRGNTIEYAKGKRKLQWLASEFEIEYNSNIPKSSVRRGYGMHIGSGKDDTRKLQGDLYLEQWLTTKRGKDESGKIIYNYHMIYDPGLLKEFIKYGRGNVDRLSAMRIGMFHLKEIDYKNFKVKKKQKTEEDFFSRQLY